MENNELYHWGVKGMKWGIRRYQKKDGTLTSAGKKRYSDNWSDDAKEASAIKKKSVKQMSNAELRKLNERTRLEQEHARLNPTAVKKGIMFIGATAATMTTVMNLINKSDKMISLGKKAGDKIIDMAGDMVMRDLKKHGI